MLGLDDFNIQHSDRPFQKLRLPPQKANGKIGIYCADGFALAWQRPRLLLKEKLSPKVTDVVLPQSGIKTQILLCRPPHPTSLTLGHLLLKEKALDNH
jgi:hypothetical protein